MERWIIDTRYALKHLRSRPLYSALWVLTLALGIGGTAATSVILSNFLLKPLPYQNEAALFGFWASYDWAEAEHVALRPDYPGFDAVATYRQEPVALRRGLAPARMIHGIASSTELFDVLGVKPLRGRTFLPGEDLDHGPPPVLVLSHRLWQELGGGEDVLGSLLEVNGSALQVVGIMPKGFFFPEPRVDLWMTASLDPENRSGNYALVGRAANRIDSTTLEASTQQIATRLAERFEYPEEWDKTKNPFALPLREELLGSAKSTLLATQIAMIAILLMAGANVAALMLGQLGTRTEELQLRYALGAPRSRITGQFVIEAVILGLAAGIFGSILALAVYRLLLGQVPLGILADTLESPTVQALSLASLPVGLQLTVASLGLSLLGSLVIGLVPVLALGRRSGHLVLTGSGRGSLGSRGGKVEGGLVIAEIAVASLLVAVAGLLLQSTSNLRQIDTGIDTNDVAVVSINMPSDGDSATRLALVERLRLELSSLPGVKAAAAVQQLPLSGGGWTTGFAIENRDTGSTSTTYLRMVTDDYFEVMGLSLRSGRGFQATDGQGGQEVAVINQALADRFFDGVDPIGQSISHGLRADGWTRVVGVVANEAVGGLTDEPAPARYLLYRDAGFTPQGNNFLLRMAPEISLGATLSLARAKVEQVAPQVAIERTTSMDQISTEAMGATPQLSGLLALLGTLALVLGMVGIYGVMNHFVSQRKQEWSLRLALGLEPLDVLRHVVLRGAVLISLGLVLGLAATGAAAQLLSNLLYGTEGIDLRTLSISAAVLALSGLLAASIPAWKAGRSDPASLLRK